MSESKNTVIESIGTYFPPRAVSTKQVLEDCETPIRFPLEKITGIKERRMGGLEEFSIDLTREAIQSCLNNSKYDPSEIDVLICCNISRVDGPSMLSFEPSTSVKMKKQFGFDNAIVFDISNACAGMFTGIYIVDALLKSGAIRRGMVVSGEHITHLTEVAQREIENFMDDRIACLTVGDAGAAVILEKGPDDVIGFQKLDIQTFGRYSPYCIAGAAQTGGWIMRTDSVNLTDVALKSGISYSLDMLKSAQWNPNECQHLIMHQTSKMTLNSARQEINKRLGEEIFNNSNTINNLEKRGNTASTSHMVALLDNINGNNIQIGDKVIFSVAASGLTVGAGLYVFDNLPDRIRGTKNQEEKSNSAVPFIDKNDQENLRIESIGTIPLDSKVEGDSLDLLEQAARNCLNNSNYQPSDIELIIYCGIYRTDYVVEPAYAALLAGKLEMNANVGNNGYGKTLAFDIFNGSLGFMNAMYVAQNMMRAGRCETAMIVTSEIENNATFFKEHLMGIHETGSAMILEKCEGSDTGLSSIEFNYNIGAQDLYSTYAEYSYPEETNIFMKTNIDPRIKDEYLDLIVKSVNDLLEKKKFEISDFNKVFVPQISTEFVAKLSMRLNTTSDQIIDVTKNNLDLFTSSLPYAMEDSINNVKQNALKKGLLISIGSGIQVGCAIYNF